jgi:phosphonate transport system substrate-binding protein
MLRLASVLILLVWSLRAAAADRTGGEPIRFGSVTYYNPRLMYLKFQPLMDYLGETTGRPWKLVLSYSYDEVVKQLCNGSIDVAYMGPSLYVLAHDQCGAEPVVRLNTNGSDTYHCMILVRQDSQVAELSQLAGKRFAFGPPLSASSYLVPRAMLAAAGLHFSSESGGGCSPQSNDAAGPDPTRPGYLSSSVRCCFYEQNERAARAVLLGEADACGIRDIVAQKYVGRGLKAIAVSEPIPNYPLVVGPKADPAVPEMLRQALLVRPRDDPRVGPVMASWDEELSSGFASCRDEDYQMIRELSKRLSEAQDVSHSRSPAGRDRGGR